jgi:hypothetical protein
VGGLRRKAFLVASCEEQFLRFVRTAALKHSVSVTFSADDSGTFKIIMPEKDCWNLDQFLQEIVPHRGLY